MTAGAATVSAAGFQPRRSSVVIPTTHIIVRLTPENGNATTRSTLAQTSRRPNGPSSGTSNEREQAEHHRNDERDLERVDEVFPTRSEHHEDRRRRGGDEPVDLEPQHQAPQQVGDHEMRDDQHEEVRQVGTGSEHREQRPVDEDGKGHPVLVVGFEEPEFGVSEHSPLHHEVPLVPAEPLVTVDPQQQRERDRERHPVEHGCPLAFGSIEPRADQPRRGAARSIRQRGRR